MNVLAVLRSIAISRTITNSDIMKSGIFRYHFSVLVVVSCIVLDISISILISYSDSIITVSVYSDYQYNKYYNKKLPLPPTPVGVVIETPSFPYNSPGYYFEHGF